MAKETYNTGRVVGWSTYEEFLKQNPDIDPSIVTALVYQTMVTYGAASLVDLPINKSAWSGDVLLTQTVSVPGAIWGVIPIIGLNYTSYQSKETVPDKGKIERGISNIFSCYVSNKGGTKASNATSETGYITFCAYPEILECGLDNIPLIVRGLGAEAVTSGNAYFGPEGFIFAGNGFGAKGASSNYLRALPSTAGSEYVDMDPVIDMRTTDPQDFYGSYYENAPVGLKVDSIQPLNSDAGILSVYQQKDFLAPALYGTRLSAGDTGDKKIYPLDVVAPGTVKLFGIDEENSPIGSIEAAQTRIKEFETNVPYNKGLYREPGSAVVIEYDNADENEPFPPVSNDTTVNINGIMTAATDWIYFFGMHPGGGPPNPTVASDWKGVIRQDIRSGYFSQSFIEKYGVSWKDWKTKCDGLSNAGIGMYGSYWDSVSDTDKNNDRYVGVLVGELDYNNVSPKTCSYFLIEKSTGAFADMSNGDYREWSLPTFSFVKDANASTSADRYYQSRTDFLGSWWAKNKTNGATDSDGVQYASPSRHKWLQEAAKNQSSFFYIGKSIVPYYPSSYEDFRQYFKTIPFDTFAKTFGYTNGEKELLHPDFHGRSLQEILILAGTKNLRPESQGGPGDVPGNVVAGLGEIISYMYARDDWPQSESDWQKRNKFPKAKYIVPATSDFYSMRFWEFYERDSITDDWKEVTSAVNRSGVPIWASRGQSGHNTTLSVSLVDNNTVRLPLTGTNGVIDADYINWSDLLNALNLNKRIDLLGSALRSLKNFSGTYLTLKPDGTEYYTNIQLDVFGYLSPGDINVGVTYATLTRIATIHHVDNKDHGYSVNKANWYAGFKVTNLNTLAKLIKTLSTSSIAEANANTLKILVNSHTSYSSGSSGNNGKPTSNELATITCYIDITEGDTYGRGTIFCKNNGQIDYIATTSNICSLVLSNETIDYNSGEGTW